MLHPFANFRETQVRSFWVFLLANKQTEIITSLAEEINTKPSNAEIWQQNISTKVLGVDENKFSYSVCNSAEVPFLSVSVAVSLIYFCSIIGSHRTCWWWWSSGTPRSAGYAWRERICWHSWTQRRQSKYGNTMLNKFNMQFFLLDFRFCVYQVND